MKRRQTIRLPVVKSKYATQVIICCLCAKVGDKDFISIFSTKGKTGQLYEKIMNYTPFEVDSNDSFQQYICSNCTSEISHWHNFIQTCIEAQNKITLVSNIEYFQQNTKLRRVDTSYGHASLESTCSKKKQTLCNIKDEFILPDIIVETASDCQNVECMPNEDTFIESRTKLAAKTCLNSNKSSLSMKTTNTSSPIKPTCNESKAGGTYCIARWCGNNSKKAPGISLFRIPKDPDRALLWLTKAEREDLKILSMEILHTKYLCMEHFNDDMFMNSSKKKLVWNALPTHFPKPDYTYRKESEINSHHQQQKSNGPETTRQIIFSKVHQPTRRRPLKPKPLITEPNIVAGSSSCPGKEETKRGSSASSLAINPQCIKREGSTLTEIPTSTLKMQRNDTNAVSKCQITNSQLSLQGSRTLAVPNTNKLATKFHEPIGHQRTANIIVCSNLNEIIDLKQDKIQTVTSTCEIGNADTIRHEDNHSDLSTVGDNRRNIGTENDTLMSVESYLNCDVESLCLEHAFRETNERIYPCRYCGEMFLVKSNLILHQTTYHSDHPVGCELCGKVLYKSRSEFMEHVCDHHSDNTHN